MVRRTPRALPRIPPSPTRLILPEYQPVRLPRAAITQLQAQQILEHYNQQIRVEYPSPATDDHWQLTALGWVGLIPLGPDLTLELAPKLPLANVFGLLECAYDLGSYRLLAGLVRGATLPELYAHLAGHLARQVIQLAHSGLAQGYVSRTADTPALRGRLAIATLAQRPPSLTLPCTFTELQIDIPENQILAGALQVILRSGLVAEAHLSQIRQSWRILTPTVTPWHGQPPQLEYTRRTARYQPAHALSHLFLTQRGPAWGAGETATIPFLVNMARLFERVVATWLRQHAPPGLQVRSQERLPLNPSGDLAFVADITLRDQRSGQPLAVLDTKYTGDPLASTADIAQVAAYAETLGCKRGYVVYPVALAQPLDVMVGAIRVQSAVFALDDALNQAGSAFLGQLELPHAPMHPQPRRSPPTMGASLHPVPVTPPAIYDLAHLQREMAICTRCVAAGCLAAANPIAGARGRVTDQIMLIGQAPGRLSVERGIPFGGPGGVVLDHWLTRAGFPPNFLREGVYLTALTRCFPGKHPGGHGDRPPSPAEIALCRPWLAAELALVDPPIVVLVGALAIHSFLGPGSLTSFVGKLFTQDSRQWLPLPHPSGVSRWLNHPANQALLTDALDLLAQFRP